MGKPIRGFVLLIVVALTNPLLPGANAQPETSFRMNRVDQVFGPIAYSPDGILMAVGGTELMLVRELGIVSKALAVPAKVTASVFLMDARTGRVLAELRGHETEVSEIAFSPDGKRLSTGGFGESPLRIWDVASRKCVASCAGLTSKVQHLAYSRDGKLLASVGWDRGVRIWDASSGKITCVLDDGSNPPHGEMFRFVGFGSDGSRLLAGTTDHLAIWNIASRRLLRTIPLQDVQSLVISPDGVLLATKGDEKGIRICDSTTGKTIRMLESHDDSSGALTFAPDGKTLASVGDETVRIWDLATGNCRRVLRMNPFSAVAVAFSPNGGTLTTAGTATIRNWRTESWLSGKGESVDAFSSAELDALRKEGAAQRLAAEADLMAIARAAAKGGPILTVDEAVVRSRTNCTVVFQAGAGLHTTVENGRDVTNLELGGGELREGDVSSWIDVKIRAKHIARFNPPDVSELQKNYYAKWLTVTGDVVVDPGATSTGRGSLRTATIEVTQQSQIVVLERKVNPLTWLDLLKPAVSPAPPPAPPK
jgi:dipeptidyl aminopeptidase/acylaminoacyl peptidase